MPMWWRTNWWLNARLTPEIANSNQTCSSGDAWPVSSRFSMNSSICSRVIFSDAMWSTIFCGVSAEYAVR